MKLSGGSAAVVQVLLAARADGVTVNRMKLAKILYLCDLEAVDQGIPPGSGVEWLWRHYGPYSDALRYIEEDLSTAGVLGVTTTENYYGSPEMLIRLLLEAPQLEIDQRFAAIVENTVARLGRLSATQLKELTYQTPPMLAAQEAGQREVRLDLAGGMPFPDIGPALARLMRTAGTMPPLDDEVGAVGELVAEIEELGPLRLEANSYLLDGE